MLDDESVNLREIANVGHGGNYFTSEQTLASLGEMNNNEALWPPMSLDVWKSQQMPTASQELIDTTKELCSRAERASEEAAEIIIKGETHINHITK